MNIFSMYIHIPNKHIIMLGVSLVILIYGSVIIIIIISSYITHSAALNTRSCAVIVGCRMIIIA